MRIRNLAAMVSFCALLATPALAADDLDKVIEKLAEKQSKHKTVQYKMKGTMEQKGEGFSFKMDNDMALEYQRTGEKSWKQRMDTTMKGVQKFGDQEQKTEGTSMMVSDEKLTWVLSDMAGQKSAIKMKSSADPLDVKAQQKALEATHEYKLLPDEKLDGKSAWVVETKPRKDKTAAAPSIAGMQTQQRTITWYDQETGIPLRVIMFDDGDKEIGRFVSRDIKINGSIKPERFEFKVPEGVPVMDMTRPMTAPPSEASDDGTETDGADEKPPTAAQTEEKKEASETQEPAKQEAPREEPKKEEKKKDPIGGLLKKIK